MTFEAHKMSNGRWAAFAHGKQVSGSRGYRTKKAALSFAQRAEAGDGAASKSSPSTHGKGKFKQISDTHVVGPHGIHFWRPEWADVWYVVDKDPRKMRGEAPIEELVASAALVEGESLTRLKKHFYKTIVTGRDNIRKLIGTLMANGFEAVYTNMFHDPTYKPTDFTANLAHVEFAQGNHGWIYVNFWSLEKGTQSALLRAYEGKKGKKLLQKLGLPTTELAHDVV